MIEPELLAMLRCPVSKDSLEIASESVIAELNGLIEQGDLRDVAEQKITEPIESGLIANHLFYPIRSAIPSLVQHEAIDLNQLDSHKD